MGTSQLTVYTISDASGETAELVARAAASQFRGHSIRLVRLPPVRSSEQLARMMSMAAQTPCIAVFTMVSSSLREVLKQQAAAHNIPLVDILDPLISAMSGILQAKPSLEAGLLHLKDEQYFDRMDAIDFAIKFDDGKDPKGLTQADLVLVGVSRTSKTPTCMYLAQHRGIKAANLPLVMDSPLPDELFTMTPGRVVGLTLQAKTLFEIRQQRRQKLKLSTGANYASMEYILQELEYAETIFRRLRCPVVDVTHKAIEETAAELLELTQRKETYV